MFAKGHKINLGRKNPGTGRKKSLSTLMKEAIERDAQSLPLYFQTLSEKAKNGDREAAIYLIDRHLGKAKQPTDPTVQIILTPDALELSNRRLFAIREAEVKLIEEYKGGNYALQGQREEDGSSETINGEEAEGVNNEG